MWRFSCKVFLFLAMIISVNQLLIHAGYLFSTKNDYILIRNLQGTEHGKINIKVFGSSRIENGISPEWMEKGFKERGINTKVFNCGMNGRYLGWGLKMYEKYYDPCDIIIIEIITDKNLMFGSDHLPSKPTCEIYLDQCLCYFLNHYLVINQLPNLVSDIRGKLPIKYMNTHPDGWTEAHYYKDDKKTNSDHRKNTFLGSSGY